MSANALAVDPSPPSARRKNPAKLSAQEALILYRMRQIDRGQGCHTSVEKIGRSVDPLYRDFSVSQTRRHLARLRQVGVIVFAGQTKGGCNVYLIPGHHEYQKDEVPVCDSRPVDHLRSLPSGNTWSTERARALLNLTDVPDQTARVTVVDGYPVNKQLLKNYSETTIRRAIAALKAAYPDLTKVQSKTSLLKYFIGLEREKEKKRQATAQQEAQRREPTGTRLPDDVQREILALMVAGKTKEAAQLAAAQESAAGQPAAAQESEAGQPAAAAQSSGAKSSAAQSSAIQGTAVQSSAAQSPAVQSSAAQSPTARSAAAQLPERSVAEVVADYLAQTRGQVAPDTTTLYGQKAKTLNRLLGDLPLSLLTPVELAVYKRKRRAERVSDGTIKLELKVLTQALIAGVKAGSVDKTQVESILCDGKRAGPPKPGPGARGDL